MTKAERVIAFISLVALGVNAVWFEYYLVMRFGVLFDVFMRASALLVLLGALFRAPEGYEDETGFHLGALADAGLS